MTVYPAIDLLNGKAVQLIQGKEKKFELNNPVQLAQKFNVWSTVHLIDLNAAMGQGNNQEIVKEILKLGNCRVGGGIRSIEKAQQLIEWDAEKVIIGTQANPKFLKELKKAIGKDKIIVALDSKKGKISINGWTKELQETTLERAKKLERYCSEFLYTCIDREGKMNGIDWKTIQELKKTTKNQLTVAGGISKISEIKKLEKQNINSVLGMALYANQVNLSKFIIPLLDFKKQKLIPTIVQEESTREVLMLAYSNAESLEQVWKTEKAWYWSRKWNRLWMKGEKSGNIQKIKKVEFDCDQDTILFTVEQTGTRACHKNTETCFGNRKPNSTFLNQLEKIIYTRKNVRTKTSSYTKKLFENPVLLRKKLREEINEVIEADQKQDRNNMVWELADIQYFLTVMAAKNNVSIKEVGKELAGRNK